MRTYVNVTVLCACAEVCLYHIILCITFAHAVYYALSKNRLIVKAKAWDFIREHRVVCSTYSMKCRDGGYIYPLRIDEFYIIYEIDA